ncbi:MAG TPA: ATP-dependent Clp protease ATP-binding subunit [Blastocatellia bacterium]|nr:ATP-dependent Clp protease ATP-binding subunit [Blastocatellia bacterium]
MAELIQEYSTRIEGDDGTIYTARTYGKRRPDGTWEGWLEFHAAGEGRPVLRTARETSQPNRTAIEYWAAGLQPVYLEGAYGRAQKRSRPARGRAAFEGSDTDDVSRTDSITLSFGGILGGTITGSVNEIPEAGQTASSATVSTPTLDRYGRDLTSLARLGKLAEIVGRDAEINRVVITLARTQKTNPLLLGEAGVGKTAIVEGLACSITRNQVPPVLSGKRIVEIDVGSITAGTSLRGQFEERLRNIINEAALASDVILFIDEIHMLVGAGSAQDSANDAAQMLKPALARGDISCIGATTQDEYARFISKDAALERRFSPIRVKELSSTTCLEVLSSVASRIIERQSGLGHTISIAPDALRAAVELTDRYVKERHQPDKCIDALDLACAQAIVAGREKVTPADIAAVVSEWTSIPTRSLTHKESHRYRNMETAISRRVIGQTEAVRAVSRAVRTALAGMKSPSRPTGVFLFLGPSGVGKTQLAKEVARFLFGTVDALIRFDMSEYQDKHALSNLVGAARGYITSDRPGRLTEALRRRPYSVVLLDEIEKAHPDIFNIFMAAFDDGRITDNHGRTIDCTNAIYVLTSNLATGPREATVGFSGGTASGRLTSPAMRSDNRLREQVARFLRPELVNRLTEVVEFQPLSPEDLRDILDLLLEEKIAAAKARGIALRVDETAKAFLIEKGYDPKMGARPLERAVERFLVQPLVDATFSGELAGTKLAAVCDGDGIVFRAGNRTGRNLRAAPAITKI